MGWILAGSFLLLFIILAAIIYPWLWIRHCEKMRMKIYQKNLEGGELQRKALEEHLPTDKESVAFWEGYKSGVSNYEHALNREFEQTFLKSFFWWIKMRILWPLREMKFSFYRHCRTKLDDKLKRQ